MKNIHTRLPRPRLYFDAAATTPLDGRVCNAMQPFLKKHFGNAGSIHTEGVFAKHALADARQSISRVLGAHPDEIIFTSGGTESNNLAIFGVVENALKEVSGDYRKIHVVTSAIEHSSVLEVCREIEKRGGRVSYIPVDAHGRILIAELKKQLTPQTTLVSVMLANNEIGTLQPISEIGKAIRKVRKEKHSLYPYMHVDAAQAPVYVPVHVPQLGIDLLSIDGHKIYGPQGVGLLYMRRGVAIEPRFYGGGQEGGHRSGTEPLALVIGMAEALEIAEDEREKNVRKMRLLHNYFVERLHARLSETVLNGDEKEGLPNIVNVSIPETESDFLVIALDERGIACASRSACHAQDDSSYVVSALKKGREIADGTVRFSMLTTTTKKEIKYVVSMLEEAVAEAKRARAIVNEQRLH